MKVLNIPSRRDKICRKFQYKEKGTSDRSVI
jgi:hypothetical protein